MKERSFLGKRVQLWLWLGLLSVLLLSACATAICSTCNTCPNTAGMAGYN